MKFILLGNDLFGENLWRGFSQQGHECVLIISKPKDLMPAGHLGLHDLARKEGVNFQEIDNVNQRKVLQELQKLEFDFTVSCWPSILGADLINMSKLGVIGTHPTPLPLGRGRHPLHWLIYMGFFQFYLTFFQMNLKIDAGDIIHQEKFKLPKNPTIRDVLNELNSAGFRGACKIGKKLDLYGSLPSLAQRKIDSPFLRARTIHDLYIDFRSSALSICNLVNSYSEPFNFAKILLFDLELPIKHCTIIPNNLIDNFTPPGYVKEVNKSIIIVKAYDELIQLTSTFDVSTYVNQGDYIYPPSFYFAKSLK